MNARRREHLVGYLSVPDADSYLVSALTDEAGPAIPGSIRQRIVAASGGLPLYLDLAVTTYLDLLSRGETPMDANFGQPLPEVAGKIRKFASRYYGLRLIGNPVGQITSTRRKKVS